MTEFMQSYGASGNLVGIWYHQTLEMFCSLDECDCSDDNIVTGNLGANCPPWARLAIFNNRRVLRDRIEDRAFVVGDTARIMGEVCEVDSPRFPWVSFVCVFMLCIIFLKSKIVYNLLLCMCVCFVST